MIPEPASADPLAESLWENFTGLAPDDHVDAYRSGIDEISACASGIQAHFGAHGLAQGAELVDFGAEQALRVGAAAEVGVARVKQSFLAANAGVSNAADAALATISGAGEQALIKIEASFAAQSAQVREGFSAQRVHLDEAGVNTGEAISADLQAAAERLRLEGEATAAGARARGTESAANYRAAGGEDLEGERNEARAQAATQVAEECAQQATELAEQAARDLESKIQEISVVIAGALSPSKDALDGQESAALASMADSAAMGRQQVQSQMSAAAAAVREQSSAALSQLDMQQQVAEQNLREQASTVAEQLQQAASAAKQVFDDASAQLSASLNDELSAVLLLNTQDDVPMEGDAEQAVSLMIAELEAMEQESLAALTAAAAAGREQILTLASQGLAALEQSINAAVQSASAFASAKATALGGLADEAAGGLNQLAVGVEQSMASNAQSAIAGAADIVNQSTAGLTAYQAEMATTCAQSVSDAKAKLEGAKTELDAKIHAKAEEEASKIQPWYKDIAGFVVNVVVGAIVFGLLVFVGVATLGTGWAALILIFGVAGAASFVAGYVSSCLVTGEQVTLKGVLSKAIEGGASGLLLLSGAGILAYGFGMSAADQLSDKLVDGVPFNFAEFVTVGIVSSLTAGIAKGASRSLGKHVTSLNKAWMGWLFPKASNTWNTFQSLLGKHNIYSNPRAVSRVYSTLKNFWSDAAEGAVEEGLQPLIEAGAENAGVSSDPDKAGPGEATLLPEKL